MRRTLTAVACVLLLALCIWLMELVEPVEAPQPTPTATATQTPEPPPTPSPTPGTVSIPMPDEFDGNLDNLWVGIPVEGMPE